MNLSFPILRGVSFARSFLTPKISRRRASGFRGTETLHKIQCLQFRASVKFQSTTATPHIGSAILSFSQADGATARGLSNFPNVIARREPLFSRYTGTRARDLLNFCRAILAAGKPILRTLLQSLQESSCVSRVLVGPFDHHSAGPFSGLVAASDGHRGSKRKQGNVRFSSGEIQNV